MKPFPCLLPLALFSVLSATYGETINTDTTSSIATTTLSTMSSTSSSSSSISSSATDTLSTATSTLSTTNSTSSSPSSTSSPQPCTDPKCPTTPYNTTEKFCLLSLASQDFKNDFANGTCPNDSEIHNISEFFEPCELMCLWNPFITIRPNNTIITTGYCPGNNTSTCSNGVSMFGSCGILLPCQRGLDCNETFKVCIQTKALIITPILTMVAIVLGIYLTMVIRKKNKYRNQLRLNDDDDGSSFFHDNSAADENNFPISLPTLAYKRNRGGQDDASMGKKDIGQPHIGGLRTDDLLLFDDQTK